MANEYLDKLRSVGMLSEHRKTRTEKWVHDGDRTGSYQTEHWDGRQDVNISPPAIKVDREILEEVYGRH